MAIGRIEQGRFQEEPQETQDAGKDLRELFEAAERITGGKLGQEYGRHPELSEFRGSPGYSDRMIEDAEQEVRRIEDRIRERLVRLSPQEWVRQEYLDRAADGLEALIAVHAELSNWFGENAMVSRTTRFDDLKHGIDIVVEFAPEEEGGKTERLALAVDVTMSTNALWGMGEKEGKFQKNLGRILGTKPAATVTFFTSQVEGDEHGKWKKGPITKVIPVVVGLDHTRLLPLFTLADQPHARLENHPAQLVFLKQIWHQLQIYGRQNIADPHVLENVQKASALIDGLVRKKNNKQREWFESDRNKGAIGVKREFIKFYEEDRILGNLRRM